MKKLKVLIADDSERLLVALRMQLERHGLDVATCSDSYMALAHAQKHSPDVMVLDVRMPAGDGFSVLERMLKLPEVRGIPVIFITGDSSTELDFKASQMGAFALMHKPIVLSTLLRLIDESSAPARPADPKAHVIAVELDDVDNRGFNS